jgi:hypothetical protein
LPQLREKYRELVKSSKYAAPWYELARKAQLNQQTVQRLLGCTRVQRPNTGAQLANIEALAEAMGYRIEFVKIDDTKGDA